MMTVRREDLPKFHDPVSAQAEADRAHERQSRREAMMAAAHRDAPGDSLWLVLSVEIGRELDVEKALAKENIQTWVPMFRGPRRFVRHRLFDGIAKPVLDGYVLVNIVPNARSVSAFGYFDHVHHLLPSNERPVALSKKTYEDFKALADESAFDVTVKAQARKLIKEQYPEGHRAVVKQGPMRFMEVVITGYRGSRRVRAKNALMDNGREIIIPIENLEDFR